MGHGRFSAHDVARELRRRLTDPGDVKIHKLLYYAQGWHLTYHGEPLFAEAIEAWANGPVVKDLWADEKHDRGAPSPSDLDGPAIATLEYILGRYGRLTGKQLIRQTHLEDPWRDVSECDDPSLYGTAEITHKALIAWFERDEEYLAHQAEALRLRESKVFSFAEPAITPAMRRAVERVIGRPVADAV